ncbi:hypothetical protein Acr_12g0003190 [Actinidia rufa]|uniref:Uncharacterized protein n=1 Tax=Actinidia rufa TaxID=165716 RepID=A0A7J0FGF4_9ERIC|nr:hypothetical protein Acr_12g0003190 [Actinidia rufa]
MEGPRLIHSGDVETDETFLFIASRKAMWSTAAGELQRRTVRRILADLGYFGDEDSEIDAAIRHMYWLDLKSS